MRRFLAPSLLALTALATALTAVFPWAQLEGPDAPAGFVRYAPDGWDLESGRWLIAVGLAGFVWALVYVRSRNIYVALAAVALASGAVGIGVSAVNDYGLDSIEPLVASLVWLAAALFVLWLQWWGDGHSRPVAIEIFGDFRFEHFLTTGFVGLLWSLALASGVVGVLLAVIEFMHEESILIGLLAGVAAAAGAIVWLLVVRLLLETVVVFFRIHDEIDLGNALELRAQRQEREGATTAAGRPGTQSPETV